LIPTSPCRVLDIGAGTGADAAWLAGNGHHVVAVEPTKELRIPAMALHCSNLIDWIDDSLPNLTITKSKFQSFDLIMLTSVWMHLDEYERLLAMPNLLSLLASGGVILMSLRHGPLLNTRRMFEVSAEETILLARDHGLRAVFSARTQSVQSANRFAGVEWSRLAFQRTDWQQSNTRQA
jgi:SAM-dependent methyltransferase